MGEHFSCLALPLMAEKNYWSYWNCIDIWHEVAVGGSFRAMENNMISFSFEGIIYFHRIMVEYPFNREIDWLSTWCLLLIFSCAKKEENLDNKLTSLWWSTGNDRWQRRTPISSVRIRSIRALPIVLCVCVDHFETVRAIQMFTSLVLHRFRKGLWQRV